MLCFYYFLSRTGVNYDIKIVNLHKYINTAFDNKMAISQNTEELKNELGSLIWRMATNLVHGGKVSPVQFMDYTLGALFYRFISENITEYCNQLMAEAGVPNPDYANMSDEMAENARDQIINAKGFYILPSQLFINVANGDRKSVV